jgi:tetratricopeptide (TPR) repeat protein
LRDAVARSVPDAERRAASAAAARHFRVPSSAPEERRLPLLARHAAESGATAEAASLYLALARRAQERHAYIDAEATYSRALELIAPGDARGQLQAFTGRATMRYRIGRSEDALADFAKARELAASLGDTQAQAELLLDEATALDWANDARASARRVEQAREILDSMRDVPAPTRARYLVASGRSLYRVGKHAEASQALERAAAAAEGLGAEGYEVLVVSLVLLETILAELGRIEDAAGAAERAIALAEDRGDLLHLGSALNNRRMLQIAQGNLDGAIADQLRFVRIGRELGMTLAEYYSEWNLGEMLCQAGDAGGAEPHVRRAIEIERAHPEVGTRPIAVLLQARLHAWLGDASSARAALEQVRSLEQAAAERGRSSGLLTASEQVLADTVEASTRAAEPAELELLVERSARDSVEQEPLEVLDLCARAALRAGRRAEALTLWDRAEALAARLPNLFAKRFAAGRALAATPLSGAS